MANVFPPNMGAVQTLSGTSIVNTYTAPSTTLYPGKADRLRFYVETVLAGGSGLTTVTIKLQFRYSDTQNAVAGTNWIDLPSHLDDVAGSAQPKGNTFEIEHAFTVTAGSTQDFSFYLDKPQAVAELRTAIKANTTGNSADSVTVWAVMHMDR